MRNRIPLVFALAFGVSCTTILGGDFEISDSASGGGATGGSATGGSATGGSATGGSATGGSATGGQGGVPAGTEICGNGTDDDDDGDIDCEDADCGSFQCLAAIPPTWTGPVSLTEVAFGQAVPTCPAAFANEAHNGVSGLGASDVTCNQCTCAPGTPSCTPAPIGIFSALSCGGMAIAESNIINGCDAMSSVGGQPSLVISAPTASVSCTPGGGGVATTPAPTWTTLSRTCEYTGGFGAGCTGTDVCVPRPGGGAFGDRLCILKSGDNVCPDPFTDRHVYSDDAGDVTDDRDCSACACEQASASCSLTTRFYTNSSCTGSAALTIANNGVCAFNSNPNGTFARATLVGTPTGTCQVDIAADPRGGVTTTGPFTTVCCMP